MARFPLFRLPLLPLENVLNKMYVGEITMLFLCSEKTKKVIKAFKKSVSIDFLSSTQIQTLSVLDIIRIPNLEVKNTKLSFFFTVKVDAGDGIEMNINLVNPNTEGYQDCFPISIYVECIERQNKYMGKQSKLDIGDITVPMVLTDNRRMHTFWSNQSNGLMTLVNYSKKLFNTQTIEYFIEGSRELKFSENLRTTVKGMAEQTISTCIIHKPIFKDDDYKFFLDNVHPTIRFEKYTNHIWNRSDDFQHKTSFKSEYFKMHYANWLALDNLLTMDCVTIRLWKTRFTNADFCQYVKLWMDGKFARLQMLTMELREDVNSKYFLSVLKKYSPIYTIIQTKDYIFIKRQNKTVATIINQQRGSSENMLVFHVHDN